MKFSQHLRLPAIIFSAFFLSLVCFSAPLAAQEKTKPAPEVQTPEPLPPQIVSETNGDYTIGPGDVLDVRIIKQPELSGKFRVNYLGTVTIPLVGPIQAAGLSEIQLTELLRTAFLKYIREPQVYVGVVEYASQNVTVVGAIGKPGKYPIRRNTRLMDILLAAGGLGPAAGDKVLLLRSPQQPADTTQPGPVPDETQPEVAPEVESINVRDLINGKLALNRVILPGDVISVPEAASVYVIGQVVKPGQIPMKSPITLSQAVYLAGGVTPLAAKAKTTLLRVSSERPGLDEFRYNFKDIEKKKIEDPVLQAGDVVFMRDSEIRNVGISFYKAFITGISASLGFLVIGR